MSALRPWVLVGAMIAIATFGSCSGSEVGTPGADNVAGETSARGEAGTPGSAGRASAAGGAATADAGADAGPSAAGDAGQDSAGGASAGASSEASAGAAGADAGEALTFCPRLMTPAVLAYSLALAYDHAVFADCRVKWVTSLYLQAGARSDFLNSLDAWSQRLWGCLPPPVANFALIYQTAPLTSADAAALIDDYMAVAIDLLTLSSAESQAMRAALGRLSQQTIAQDSPSYSHSTCDAGGAGGTGGTAGTSGTAGTGGIAG
ncbi:MAG TPA: hypothetical protein VGF76_12685, partial [Polyangiaceae bacterium]